MLRLSVCVFVCGVWLASGLQPHAESGFYYTKHMSIFRRHMEEECRVCFGHECVPLDVAKCQYYMASSELMTMNEDEEDCPPNNELQNSVDDKLYDFIEKAHDYQDMACIPLISTYTNCDKENVCSGCITCSCDGGRWECSTEECRAEPLTAKQLLVALTRLKEEEQAARFKRSTNNTTGGNGNATEIKITFEELSQWLNENNTKIHINEEDITDIVFTSTDPNVMMKTTSDPDHLAFEEVLSNIAIDNTDISAKYSTLQPVESEYVNFIDIVTDSINITDEHTTDYTNKIKSDAPFAFDENSFKVDLLTGLKQRLEDFGVKNFTGRYRDIESNFESNNFLDDVSIVKRDVSQMNETKIEENPDENNTDTLREFKHNVLYPLISIIGDKEGELNQLLAIKDSLIELIKGMDSNFTLDQMPNITEKNKTLFSIYKLEIIPEEHIESHYETRRSGHNIIDTYVKKLQHDVIEVVRDLRLIKQSLMTKKLPRDLALLLRGMNHYVSSQGKSRFKNYRQRDHLRRHYKGQGDVLLKHLMREILELVDKEVTAIDHESLNQLSDTTKSILQRVIKQNQIDDVAIYGIKLSDSTYNLTKELESIGVRWPEVTENFFDCPPSEKLYHIKLLHLMLMVDMNKLTNALKLVNFAQNRRTNFDTNSSDKEMSRVQNYINDVNNKVQKLLLKSLAKNETENQNNITVIKKDVPTRRSFLKQIKMLFKKSKKDIQGMLHKKVPQAEIVNVIANNKLEDMPEQKMVQYEDTLKKWQNKFNVRAKRSFNLRKSSDRMKNILPSYLIGKVDPAINQSRMKRTRRPKIHRNGRNSNKTANVTKHKATNTTTKSTSIKPITSTSTLEPTSTTHKVKKAITTTTKVKGTIKHLVRAVKSNNDVVKRDSSTAYLDMI